MRSSCRSRTAGFQESCVRTFNYPHEGYVRRLEDMSTYGIKTFFCSDVCAAYDRRTFHEMGGFQTPCIFNEDSIFACKLITLGYEIAYAADARVAHSHNYTNIDSSTEILTTVCPTPCIRRSSGTLHPRGGCEACAVCHQGTPEDEPGLSHSGLLYSVLLPLRRI